MMWNKGNGGSANQDDGRWFLRGGWNQQLTVQAGLGCVVDWVPQIMAAEEGLSAQRYV